MNTPISTSLSGSQGYLVAIEVQEKKVFHVDLTKIQKYPKLYTQLYDTPPSYPYPSYHNGPQYYLNLHKLPQGSGHLLWEYLSFGTFTRLRGYHSETTQEWYFKDIFHLHNLANKFDMEHLKSESAKEIFRKAQQMGLMELTNLLEELNYQSDLFPSLSVYLEKRLVGSALDYYQGGSQRALAELQAKPSLSVAQILLKALIEISESGCKLGEKNSTSNEVYTRKLDETTAASDILGWDEPKVPDTRWINPNGEITGVRKSVDIRFFGAAAKQATRREKTNSPEPPFERAAAREPTLDVVAMTYAQPLPTLVRCNPPMPLPLPRDASTTLSYRSAPYSRSLTIPEIQVERTTKAVGYPELTLTGSEGNVPEYKITSLDTPRRSSRSSSNTLEGSPVQVGPMDWDVEYDYDS
ncbi:hypothetical protein FNAPI_7513 [Fusarium napiforme]|uniref:Uncharacterized protein n=1 Tax=Fusarium napiforme TaxID=42672 RepID=A0A8H5JDF6_9HYPO|nr:hypothetical protein FNAPI_7513 [Fusarium napiforme]